MFKVFIVLFVVTLVGCGQSQASSIYTRGIWKSSEPGMIAHVSGGNIKIDWITGDTRALYWKGTFPRRIKSGNKTTSIGDVDLMSSALLASLDTKKTFTYIHEKLEFRMSILGITKTVRLSR